VPQLHYDGTTSVRMLKPLSFRISHSVSLFSTPYIQELQQAHPVTTVEAVYDVDICPLGMELKPPIQFAWTTMWSSDGKKLR